MITQCFPANHVGDAYEINKEYNNRFYHSLKFQMFKRWFFVTEANNYNVIGFCSVSGLNVTKLSNADAKKVNPYKINELTDDIDTSNKVTLKYYIENVCKDGNFKNVGKFLLDNVIEYYKNADEKLSLVVESTRYKDNYIDNLCTFTDEEKYYDSCMKLIEYYKSFGFKVSPNLFFIENCDLKGEDNRFNVLHVMILS
jgi:hypothetical protein